MNQYQDNARERLYQEFKAAVTSDPESMFYDESSLVEIFDYAGDQNDDATRTEVIALASRLYPYSEPMKIRKALYYYYIEREDMARELANSPHESSALWDILDLRLNPVEDDELEKRLDSILKRYKKLEDEEIIQLVDLSHSHSRLDWSVKNVDALKAKTSYPPTLYYEIAVLASMDSENDTVIAMTEQLTSLEPFYAPYWMMQARAYFEMMKFDDAINSLDYALAVDPDMAEAILLKIQILVMIGTPVESMLPQIEKLAAAMPDDTMVNRTYALALRSLGRGKEANDMLRSFIDSNPTDRNTLIELLTFDPSADDAVEKYYAATPDTDESDWQSMAVELMGGANHEAAAKVLEVYGRHTELTFARAFYLQELYMSKRYDTILEMIDINDSSIDGPYRQIETCLIYGFTLVRKNMKPTFRKFFKKWISYNKDRLCPTPSDRICNTGASYYLHTLYDELKNLDEAAINHLDPFRPIRTSSPEFF